MPSASRAQRSAPTPAPAAAEGAATDAVGRGASIGRAYDRLRELIVHGRLAPGSRIVESEIAERLHVSRTPARSALHRLRQEGYVTAVDRAKEQRLIVAPLTREDGRELFYIVGQIEGLAAYAGAELAPAERGVLVRRLRQLNEKLAQAARAARPDPVRIFDLDTAFHRAYVEGAAGARLIALHDAIKPQAERYARLYTSALLDEIATSVEEHAAVIREIEGGDPSGAQHAVETNWRNAAARMARVIDTVGERGTW